VTTPVEIPLKRKYRSATNGRFKGGHNDSRKKHGDGWSKHKLGKGINHVPYVVGVDLTRGGKRFKRPAYEDEVPDSTRRALADKSVQLPRRSEPREETR
jgi:hypothetical protein